jgi:hypothetical protein
MSPMSLSANIDAFLMPCSLTGRLDEPGGGVTLNDVGTREEASGPPCRLSITNTPLLDESVRCNGELTRKHELVAFDPQSEEAIT